MKNILLTLSAWSVAPLTRGVGGLTALTLFLFIPPAHAALSSTPFGDKYFFISGIAVGGATEEKSLPQLAITRTAKLLKLERDTAQRIITDELTEASAADKAKLGAAVTVSDILLQICMPKYSDKAEQVPTQPSEFTRKRKDDCLLEIKQIYQRELSAITREWQEQQAAYQQGRFFDGQLTSVAKDFDIMTDLQAIDALLVGTQVLTYADPTGEQTQGTPATFGSLLPQTPRQQRFGAIPRLTENLWPQLDRGNCTTSEEAEYGGILCQLSRVGQCGNDVACWSKEDRPFGSLTGDTDGSKSIKAIVNKTLAAAEWLVHQRQLTPTYNSNEHHYLGARYNYDQVPNFSLSVFTKPPNFFGDHATTDGNRTKKRDTAEQIEFAFADTRRQLGICGRESECTAFAALQLLNERCQTYLQIGSSNTLAADSNRCDSDLATLVAQLEGDRDPQAANWRLRDRQYFADHLTQRVREINGRVDYLQRWLLTLSDIAASQATYKCNSVKTPPRFAEFGGSDLSI